MHGSSSRPSKWTFTPRIFWLTATKIQAAVPVSHQILGLTLVDGYFSGNHLDINKGLSAVQITDFLQIRR